MKVRGIRADEDFILRALGVGGRIRIDKLKGLGSRACRSDSGALFQATRYGFRLVHILCLADIISCNVRIQAHRVDPDSLIAEVESVGVS